MSILKYIFDNEVLQRHDIEELKAQQHWRIMDARRARHEKKETGERLSEMDGEIGELALFCRTAVTLMIEKGLVSHEEFFERMRQVDESDGRADGKYTGE